MVYFKWVNCVAYEVFFSKTVANEKTKEERGEKKQSP